jgi:predicted transcriptional regulator
MTVFHFCKSDIEYFFRQSVPHQNLTFLADSNCGIKWKCLKINTDILKIQQNDCQAITDEAFYELDPATVPWQQYQQYGIMISEIFLLRLLELEDYFKAKDVCQLFIHLRKQHFFSQHLKEIYMLNIEDSLSRNINDKYYFLFIFDEKNNQEKVTFFPSSTSGGCAIEKSDFTRNVIWNNNYGEQKYIRLRNTLTSPKYVQLDNYVDFNLTRESFISTQATKALSFLDINACTNSVFSEADCIYLANSNYEIVPTCVNDLILSGFNRDRIERFAIINSSNTDMAIGNGLFLTGSVKEGCEAHVWSELQSENVSEQIKMLYPRSQNAPFYSKPILKSIRIKSTEAKSKKELLLDKFLYFLSEVISTGTINEKFKQAALAILTAKRRDEFTCTIRRNTNIILNGLELKGKPVFLTTVSTFNLLPFLSSIKIKRRKKIRKKAVGENIPEDERHFYKNDFRSREYENIHFVDLDNDNSRKTKYKILAKCDICLIPSSLLINRADEMREVLRIVGNAHLILKDSSYYDNLQDRFPEKLNICDLNCLRDKGKVINQCYEQQKKIKQDKFYLLYGILNSIAHLEQKHLGFEGGNELPKSKLYLFNKLKTRLIQKAHELKMVASFCEIDLKMHELKTLDAILQKHNEQQNKSWREFQKKRALKPEGNNLKQYLKANCDLITKHKTLLPILYKLSARLDKAPKKVSSEIERVVNLLKAFIDSKAQELSRSELEKFVGIKRTTLGPNYIRPALDNGFIEMTLPEKPKSNYNKYRITEKGRVHYEQYQASHAPEDDQQEVEKSHEAPCILKPH